MRSQLSNLYNHIRTHLKIYTKNLAKFIRKKDEDDNHFNNPFIIY
jgi:hypothetical protein